MPFDHWVMLRGLFRHNWPVGINTVSPFVTYDLYRSLCISCPCCVPCFPFQVHSEQVLPLTRGHLGPFVAWTTAGFDASQLDSKTCRGMILPLICGRSVASSRSASPSETRKQTDSVMTLVTFYFIRHNARDHFLGVSTWYLVPGKAPPPGLLTKMFQRNVSQFMQLISYSWQLKALHRIPTLSG